jgi:hypothetical protein
MLEKQSRMVRRQKCSQERVMLMGDGSKEVYTGEYYKFIALEI